MSLIGGVVSRRLKEAGFNGWRQPYIPGASGSAGYKVCHAGHWVAEVWHCDNNGDMVKNAPELAAYTVTLLGYGYEVSEADDPSVLKVRQVSRARNKMSFELQGTSTDRWVIFVQHEGETDWINTAYTWNNLPDAADQLHIARADNPANRYALFKETTVYVPEQM